MYNHLHTIPACDRQTDRQSDGKTDKLTDKQTSCHDIFRAMHTRHAVKTTKLPNLFGTCAKHWRTMPQIIQVNGDVLKKLAKQGDFLFGPPCTCDKQTPSKSVWSCCEVDVCKLREFPRVPWVFPCNGNVLIPFTRECEERELSSGNGKE